MEKQENKTNGNGEAAEFFGREAERLAKERAEFIAENGYREFLTLPKGLHTIRFLDEVPKPNKTYEGRVNFGVVYNGKEYDWSINTKSPMYADIIRELAAGHHVFEVLRSGSGMETRYEIEVQPE